MPHALPFQDDSPGPGFYNVIHQSPVSNSVSLSKKGTCTFPSMCARMDTIISKYPAATAYTLPSRFVSKKDFSNSCSSMFQLPSFAKVLKFETPAPNHYNVGFKLACLLWLSSAETLEEASDMEQKKNPILNFSANPLPLPAKPSLPGPGQYEIVDYAGPPKHFISSASFVSNTSRWTMAPSQPGLPGPATYKPEFPGKQSFLYNEDKKWIPVL
ncbi:hypothetical protein PAL_GLEAN10015146 [Pteropus alecto]|uniref:O(6)-methylguanine-induced apoptosis 2 n=1 Tax=Pteropus alecto TaxID=9402 RepID=L5JRT3_PTEAL|nr:hypothetical protein PAL_GLEAN10015146 [Pteropus alecto]